PRENRLGLAGRNHAHCKEERYQCHGSEEYGRVDDETQHVRPLCKRQSGLRIRPNRQGNHNDVNDRLRCIRARRARVPSLLQNCCRMCFATASMNARWLRPTLCRMMRSTPRLANSSSAARWRAISAEISTLDARSSTFRCEAAASNIAGVDSSAATTLDKALLRHWSSAFCSASASLSA